MEKSIRELSKENGLPFYLAPPGVPENGQRWLDDANSYVVAERGSRTHLPGDLLGRPVAISQNSDRHPDPCGRSKMAARRRSIRWHALCSGRAAGRQIRIPRCD